MIGLSICLAAILAPAARAAYYGSKTSDKYHYKTCPLFPLIKPAKLLVFRTPESAARARYIPCPKCRPPKPKKQAKKILSAESSRQNEPDKQMANAKTVEEPRESRTAASPVKIYEIKFLEGSDGKEKVAIFLDKFYAPEVRSIEGEKPALKIYFPKDTLLPDNAADPEAGGNFVRKIRIERDDRRARLAVVLEMKPFTAFLANPFFYEKENIYLLEISKVIKSSTK